MWRFSRQCCSTHFLHRNAYQYFILRSKALDAVAQKIIPAGSSTCHSASLAARVPLSWFMFNEDDNNVPIFIKPKSSTQATDQFGLLSVEKPSTGAEQPSVIEDGPFETAFAPTTLVDHAEESRLVNSPQMWVEESEWSVESGISRILQDFREVDADNGCVRLFSGMKPSNERISPTNRRRRGPIHAIQWSYGTIGRTNHMKCHRLRPHRYHVLRFSRTVSSQVKPKIASICSGLSEMSNKLNNIPESQRFLSSGLTTTRSTPSVNYLINNYTDTIPATTLSSSVDGAQQRKLPVYTSGKPTETPKKEVVLPPKPAVSRTIFDPLEVRIEEVPAVLLRELTKQKDVESLRAALNEHRWPHFESMKDFISELFEVFIEKGLNVDEVKRLMWDFAATNNRAYVRDWVTLSLLERIVREEGIEAAINYARLNRDLFLVKAPMERRTSKLVLQLTERLFATVFQLSNDSDIFECGRKLLDALVDLGYINNSSAYLLASVNARLKVNGFRGAQQIWMNNVLKYRATLGAHILIRAALEDECASRSVQQQRLCHILSVCEQYEHPFAGLAELIVELCKANMDEDVRYLLMRLSISGTYFRGPLNRLKDDEANLIHVERFAKLIGECMLPGQRRRLSKKPKEQSSLDCVPSKEVDKSKNAQEGGSIGIFIANRVFARKEKRSLQSRKKTKKHKVDVEKLHELAMIVQRIWGDLAEASHNQSSLDRLWDWSVKNKLEADLLQSRRWKTFFASRKGRASGDSKAT